MTYVGEGRGDAGDGLASHSGRVFSSFDRDQEGCAARDGGGWWQHRCPATNLNGLYGRGADRPNGGVVWAAYRPAHYSLKRALLLRQEVEVRRGTGWSVLVRGVDAGITSPPTSIPHSPPSVLYSRPETHTTPAQHRTAEVAVADRPLLYVAGANHLAKKLRLLRKLSAALSRRLVELRQRVKKQTGEVLHTEVRRGWWWCWVGV
ncbi:hypothetical protein CRUP_035714 [Coryphaenoides rupestris]|nr:hypothetical protein CRUP_035714 [Coryphaenoides rupestris]